MIPSKIKSHTIFVAPQIERNIISMEISKLLSKGVLELTHRSPGDFISNIFVRPKKDALTE